jgi:hypothetical protein
MPNRTIYRSSKTGQIVTKKYAEAHPSTTEKQTIKTPPPLPKK